MNDFIKAIKKGDLEKVKLLLAISDPSAKTNYAIGYASLNGRTEVVKLLLSDPRVDPSANQNGAIGGASLNGHTEVVKILLSDPRVDPSTNNNFAIGYASLNGRTEVVKLLLSDPRVDPSVNNNYSIQEAARNGRTEVIKLLLSDPRVDPSTNNNYPIRWASENDHLEVVKLLLADPRVDWRDIDEKMKIRLLKDADVGLKDELKASLLAINRITPKMKIDKEYKNLIPKSVRKNIVYRAQYEELCSLLKGEIPPIKLIALANLLKIQYDDKISWKELCGKVKFKLLEML